MDSVCYNSPPYTQVDDDIHRPQGLKKIGTHTDRISNRNKRIKNIKKSREIVTKKKINH